MSARIVVLAGDGVGPEVTAAAVRVLEGRLDEARARSSSSRTR